MAAGTPERCRIFGAPLVGNWVVKVVVFAKSIKLSYAGAALAASTGGTGDTAMPPIAIGS
jgi:hypothetical protein